VGDWKLVVNGAAADDPAAGNANRNRRNAREAVELFNMADDPGEKTNLAETHGDKVAELRRRYDALAAEAVPPKNAGRRAAE
jgi:hypothetical protein